MQQFFAGVYMSVGKYAGCGSSIGNWKLHTLTNRYYYFIFFLKVIASPKLVDFSIELEPHYSRCSQCHDLWDAADKYHHLDRLGSHTAPEKHFEWNKQQRLITWNMGGNDRLCSRSLQCHDLCGAADKYHHVDRVGSPVARTKHVWVIIVTAPHNMKHCWKWHDRVWIFFDKKTSQDASEGCTY